MEIDDKMVEKIAELAKLEFSGDARENIKKDMNQIIHFVETLNELDTTGVEPLIYMSDETNVLRKDKTKADISQEDALKNAPVRDSDYFKVPKVLSNP